MNLSDLGTSGYSHPLGMGFNRVSWLDPPMQQAATESEITPRRSTRYMKGMDFFPCFAFLLRICATIIPSIRSKGKPHF